MGKTRGWGLEAAGAAKLGLRQYKSIRSDTRTHVTSKFLGRREPSPPDCHRREFARWSMMSTLLE
jgi:hypothetical protein